MSLRKSHLCESARATNSSVLTVRVKATRKTREKLYFDDNGIVFENLAKDGAAAFWITCLGSHDHGENLAFLFLLLGE